MSEEFNEYFLRKFLGGTMSGALLTDYFSGRFADWTYDYTAGMVPKRMSQSLSGTVIALIWGIGNLIPGDGGFKWTFAGGMASVIYRLFYDKAETKQLSGINAGDVLPFYHEHGYDIPVYLYVIDGRLIYNGTVYKNGKSLHYDREVSPAEFRQLFLAANKNGMTIIPSIYVVSGSQYSTVLANQLRDFLADYGVKPVIQPGQHDASTELIDRELRRKYVKNIHGWGSV